MSSFSDGQIEQILEIFDGRVGQENAITSQEIRDRLEIRENETTPQTRAIITYLIKEEGMPIAAKTGGPNRGYFIAENEDEIYNYLGTLSSRANKIEDRHKAVLDAAEASGHLRIVPDDNLDDEYL